MLAEAPIETGTRPGTRARLILAAVRLFQERGYHGAGTAELLTLAAAPRGSLYHHFPDGKEQLACAAADWLADTVVGRIQQLRLDGLGPREVLMQLGIAMAEWMVATDYTQGALLTALSSGRGAADAALGDAVNRAYDRIESEHRRMLVTSGIATRRAEELARDAVLVGEGALILARARRDAGIVTTAMTRVAVQIDGVLV